MVVDLAAPVAVRLARMVGKTFALTKRMFDSPKSQNDYTQHTSNS